MSEYDTVMIISNWACLKFITQLSYYCWHALYPHLGPPDLNDEFERTVIENSTVEIDVSGSGEEPFPFPQQFQWMKDGVNVTNSSRISYGYPIVVFENVLREDIGNYTLTAANFRLDNESLQVGNDTGSFFLDVFCKCITMNNCG